MINVIIDGINIQVPKNSTVLQACNLLNIQIPKFCFQENLQIAGNCRMCLVEIKNSPKPVASCAMPVSNNMEIFTNTPLVQKAKESVLEFILINHPLDCPICDQASECDLQDQTMIFGSDVSRFYFKKRGVEDKYVGPFIKTIMTRCIHCTRCVRFANEICNDPFGTTGRGSHTELNFYNKNIFYSEFSGNLIDLCPVGALTSKPYSFNSRSWELKKKEAIDILDAVGSNINVDIFNNEVVRILPKTNIHINKEWITNKTRFFYDSLKYQRIEYPLIKINNKFEKINWHDAFKTLNININKYDANLIKAVCGNLIDLESFFYFKKNLNLLGISNITYLNNLQKFFNSDLTSNYLFNSSLKNIENSDLCLIINSDIREEGAILNIHLINRLKKGNFKIASIGPKLNYTYDINHLGISYDILLNILQGKHSFCKKIKKAKNPIIIFGINTIFQLKNKNIIENFKKLSFLDKKNLNLLHNQTSFLNFLEINNNKFNYNNNIKCHYLYNTDNFLNKNNKTNFIIYQGHHFTEDAKKANLILPSLTFLEKEGYYVNIEGKIQKINSILNLKKETNTDINIFNYYYIFIQNKHNNKKKKIINFFENYSYILKKNLKIIDVSFRKNIYINNFNVSYIKNLPKYLNITIFEKYSKILMNSKNILKNISNFKL